MQGVEFRNPDNDKCNSCGCPLQLRTKLPAQKSFGSYFGIKAALLILKPALLILKCSLTLIPVGCKLLTITVRNLVFTSCYGRTRFLMTSSIIYIISLLLKQRIFLKLYK
jgi:hypothetical protein